MLIIAGKLYVAQKERDAFIADCIEVVIQARKAPGCLDFSLTSDPLEPDRINVYERWESDEALLAFREGGPDGAQSARILDAEVAKFRISAVESP